MDIEDFKQKMLENKNVKLALRPLYFTPPFHAGFDTNPTMTAGLFPWSPRPLDKSWPDFKVGRSLITFMVPKPWNGPHLKEGID